MQVKNWDDQIDSIMDCFDFAGVHKAMDALNWYWVTTNGQVPEELELRIHARQMLKEATRTDKDWYCSCGGFTVEKKGELLRLLFVIDEWESENEVSENVGEFDGSAKVVGQPT